MSADGWTRGIVLPNRLRRGSHHGLWTSLDTADDTTGYDRRAALYDRIIGNQIYNRLVWGTWPSAYAEFAARAVDSASGPILDVGCGSAVFTAGTYRASPRPLMLVDRSTGMLTRARARISMSSRVRAEFVQADLFDLPFHPHTFTTVACHGMLHLFNDVSSVLRVLRTYLMSSGTLYASSLVAESHIGKQVLRAMHRAGEISAPRTEGEVLAQVHDALGDDIITYRRGSMLFIIHGPTPTLRN